MCPVGRSAELGGQLDPLGFAAGQGRRRLAEPDVAEAHVDQGLQVPRDRRLRAKKSSASSHDMSSTSAMVLPRKRDLQGVAVVAGAMADLAGHVDVGQEVHLDLDGAVTRTRLAPAATDVEREPARLVAPHLGLGVCANSLRTWSKTPV